LLIRIPEPIFYMRFFILDEVGKISRGRDYNELFFCKHEGEPNRSGSPSTQTPTI